MWWKIALAVGAALWLKNANTQQQAPNSGTRNSPTGGMQADGPQPLRESLYQGNHRQSDVMPSSIFDGYNTRQKLIVF